MSKADDIINDNEGSYGIKLDPSFGTYGYMCNGDSCGDDSCSCWDDLDSAVEDQLIKQLGIVVLKITSNYFKAFWKKDENKPWPAYKQGTSKYGAVQDLLMASEQAEPPVQTKKENKQLSRMENIINLLEHSYNTKLDPHFDTAAVLCQGVTCTNATCQCWTDFTWCIKKQLMRQGDDTPTMKAYSLSQRFKRREPDGVYSTTPRGVLSQLSNNGG